MPHDTNYIVKLIFNLTGNHLPKTAEIEYWDDTDFISKWSYDTGTNLVTATEKTDTYDVAFDEVLEARKNSDSWIIFIRTHFLPAELPRSIHRHRLIVGEASVSSFIRVDGITITDDVWTASTDKLTYGPRPAISWSWADYMAWREFRDQFIGSIKLFKKGT